MQIAPCCRYDSEQEAKEVIDKFHKKHPKSAKKFKVRKEESYAIDEI